MAPKEVPKRKWPLIILGSAVLGGGIWVASSMHQQSADGPAKIQVPSQSSSSQKANSTSSPSKKQKSKSADDLMDSLIGQSTGSRAINTVLNGVLDPAQALSKAVDSNDTKAFVARAAEALVEPQTTTEKPTGEASDSGAEAYGPALNLLSRESSTNDQVDVAGTSGSTEDNLISAGQSLESVPEPMNTPTIVDLPPTIQTAGTLQFHEKQAMPSYLSGVTATDAEDGSLTGSIRVDASGVDPNTPGTYWVNYSVTDSVGHTVTVQRAVLVINDPPTLNVSPENSKLEAGKDLDELSGVLAEDAQDGNLISEVQVSGVVNNQILGNYELNYRVTDANGATATASRTVTVFADKPELDVSKIPTSINVGDPIDVHDVTATSKYGATSIKLDGSVDAQSAGKYALKYVVTDKFGQQVTQSVMVTVLAPLAPQNVDDLETQGAETVIEAQVEPPIVDFLAE